MEECTQLASLIFSWIMVLGAGLFAWFMLDIVFGGKAFKLVQFNVVVPSDRQFMVSGVEINCQQKKAPQELVEQKEASAATTTEAPSADQSS